MNTAVIPTCSNRVNFKHVIIFISAFCAKWDHVWLFIVRCARSIIGIHLCIHYYFIDAHRLQLALKNSDKLMRCFRPIRICMLQSAINADLFRLIARQICGHSTRGVNLNLLPPRADICSSRFREQFNSMRGHPVSIELLKGDNYPDVWAAFVR